MTVQRRRTLPLPAGALAAEIAGSLMLACGLAGLLAPQALPAGVELITRPLVAGTLVALGAMLSAIGTFAIVAALRRTRRGVS